VTTHRQKRGLAQARCEKCDNDLEARNDGAVYCTNTVCVFTTKPHPTKGELNIGKAT
jgi:hypothetical protein